MDTDEDGDGCEKHAYHPDGCCNYFSLLDSIGGRNGLLSRSLGISKPNVGFLQEARN
jgi:hypothetical protein